MNIVFCEPSAQEVQALHARLTHAFSPRFRDLMLFGFSGGSELAEYLSVSPEPPDIVMVSMNLQDVNAWDFSAWLTEQYPCAKLVLTGTPPRDVEQLFFLGAAYFLYTPVQAPNADRFAARMETQLLGNVQRYLELTSKRGLVRIAFSDILYVTSEKRKISVMQPNGRIDEAYKKLDEIEAVLDQRFVRCHQSFLVNMDCVHGITNEGFLLVDNQFVPISQKRYWAAKKQYVRYIKSKG